MRRALEVFFRRRRQVLLLMVVLPLLSVVVGFFIPRPYQAGASLWAEKRYSITDATWVARWYDMLGVSNGAPAQTQAGALTELLNSRAFALQIANATDLPSQIVGASSTSSQQRDDALYNDISRNVKVAAVGNNLVTITYSNSDQRIALQVVGATIQAFASASEQLAIQSGQVLLTAYQNQLTALHNSVDAAAADLKAYLNLHPAEVDNTSKQAADAQYQILNNQLTAAQKSLSDVQSQISQLQLEINTIGHQADAFFTVQDNPTLIPPKTSRTQTLLLALAVGVGIALVMMAIYLAILMRASRAAYSAADLKAVLSVPVLAEVPSVVLAPPVLDMFAVAEGRSRPAVNGHEVASGHLVGGAGRR